MFDLASKGLFSNITKSDNNMIYNGDNLKIELTDSSEDNLNHARTNGLAIIDTGNCEQILKDNQILPQNEKLYSLNTNVKNSKYNNANDTQYTLQSLYTSLFDSKGNSINASLCSDFTIKLPTGNLLSNQSDYEYMKNLTGVDIYNKTNPFFTDFCSTYSKNNSDIVLESRHELYPKQIECNAGCIYNGIDEHGYALCKCSELPKQKVFNAGRDLIFKLFNIANHELVKCIANLFKVDLTYVYGIFTSIIITACFLILLYLHSKFFNLYDLTNNKPKVIMNDLMEINILKEIYTQPENAGVPFDDKIIENQPNQPITKFTNNNSPNLQLNKYIKENDFEEDINNNILNAIETKSPDSKKVKFNKNSKNIKNSQILPIHQLDDNTTRMMNNFINKVSNSLVANSQREVKSKVDNTINKLKNINANNKNGLIPNTSPRKISYLSNINSNFVSSHLQNNSQLPHPVNKIIDSTLPNGTVAYTVAELAKAPLYVQFEIDDRNSFTFYWHELKNGHEILNLYFYKSITTPFHIRLTILFISLSMRLCLSAMFFSDSYIKEQTGYKDKFGPDYTGWWYTLTNDILRILWPMMISVVFKNVMNLFILLKKEKVLKMNQFFKGNIRIKEAM